MGKIFTERGERYVRQKEACNKAADIFGSRYGIFYLDKAYRLKHTLSRQPFVGSQAEMPRLRRYHHVP